MAGVKDEGKRLAVRRLLREKANQCRSDRDIGREVGCHKLIVREVRSALVAAGLHPPVPGYKAGAAGRGGYVFAENGLMVREAEHILTEAGRLSKPAQKVLTELLAMIRGRPRA